MMKFSFAFNRTSMELKPDAMRRETPDEGAFNRTSMELKQIIISKSKRSTRF